MVISEEKFNETLQWYQEHRPGNIRDDIRLRDLARSLGWDVLYGNNFGDSLMFRKENKTIYYCQYGWRCGTRTIYNGIKCMDPHYHDYQNLEDALRGEA